MMKSAFTAAVLTGLRVTADAASFLLLVVVARWFGAEGVGHYALAQIVGGTAALVAVGGIEQYGFRALARDGAGAQRTFSALLSLTGLQLGLTLACLAAATFVLPALAQAGSQPVLWAVVGYLMLWSLAQVLFLPALAAGRMVLPAGADALAKLGAVAVTVGLAAGGGGSLGLAMTGFPLAGIALLAASALLLRRTGLGLRLCRDPSALLATFRRTVPFALVELVGQLYTRADLLLLAHFAPPATVGLYSPAVRLLEVGGLVAVFLGQAAFPRLARLHGGDAGAFARAADELLRNSLCLGGLLGVGLAGVAPSLMVPLFGADFVATAALLPWLAALAVLKAGENALFRVLLAAERQRGYGLALALGSAAAIGCGAALIPAIGPWGAVAATTAGGGVIVLAGAARLPQAALRRSFAAHGLKAAAAMAGALLGTKLLAGLGVPDAVAGWLAPVAYAAAAALLWLPAAAEGPRPRPRSGRHPAPSPTLATATLAEPRDCRP